MALKDGERRKEFIYKDSKDKVKDMNTKVKTNVTKVRLGTLNSIEVSALAQWDKGQIIEFVDNFADGTEVQFATIGAVETNNKIIENNKVEIPDAYLEGTATIIAWVKVIKTDSETTVKEIRIPITPRTKPADYVTPEDEQSFREQMQGIMNETKEIADSVREDADNGKFDGKDAEITEEVIKEIIGKLDTASTTGKGLVQLATNEDLDLNPAIIGGAENPKVVNPYWLVYALQSLARESINDDTKDPWNTLPPRTWAVYRFVMNALKEYSKNPNLLNTIINDPTQKAMLDALYVNEEDFEKYKKSINLDEYSKKSEIVSNILNDTVQKSILNAIYVNEEDFGTFRQNVESGLNAKPNIYTDNYHSTDPTSNSSDYPNLKAGDFYVKLNDGKLYVCAQKFDTYCLWLALPSIYDLNKYVLKEDGKGLSSNDYTDTDVSKVNKIDTIESIAKGANQAKVFNSISDMVAFLNANENRGKLPIGSNLYIRTLNVPDVWVSVALPSGGSVYNYTTDEKFVEDLMSTTYSGLNVGSYYISPLETGKVDLTDYVKNTDYASYQNAGVVKAGSYALKINSNNGVLYCGTMTKEQYDEGGEANFISKGTLENVLNATVRADITEQSEQIGQLDSDKVGFNDYATANNAGVIKTGFGASVNSNGQICSNPIPYETYQNVNDYNFISKGTLENVLNGKGYITEASLEKYYDTTKIDETIAYPVSGYYENFILKQWEIVEIEPNQTITMFQKNNYYAEYELLNSDYNRIWYSGSQQSSNRTIEVPDNARYIQLRGNTNVHSTEIHLKGIFYAETQITLKELFDTKASVESLTEQSEQIEELDSDKVGFDDYATKDKAGVLKAGSYSTRVNANNGILSCDTMTNAQYEDSNVANFISKGTLNNVLGARFVTCTQAEYDAIINKSETTLYFIVEE